MKLRLGFLLAPRSPPSGFCPRWALAQDKATQAYKWYEQGRKRFQPKRISKSHRRPFTRAIRRAGQFRRSLSLSGDGAAEQGDYDRAIDDYTRALDFKRSLTDAYRNRGKAYAA